jgi:hypothetical protein
MPGASAEQLATINAVIDRLTDTENRDDGLIIEMLQAMIGDLIANGELRPLADYIAHYTYLTRIDAEEMAADIHP